MRNWQILTGFALIFGYSGSIAAETDLRRNDGYKTAAEFISSIYDPSVDPCDDFYEYSCGKWLKRNQIPKDQASYGTFPIGSDAVAERLKRTMHKLPRALTNSRAVRMAKLFYTKCRNTDEVNQLGSQPLQDIVEKIVDFDEYDSNEIWLNMIKETRFNPLFRTYTGPDPDNSSRLIISLWAPLFNLGSADFYLNDTEHGKRISAYKKFFHDAVRLYNKHSTEHNILTHSSQIEEAFELERQLAKITVMKHLTEAENRTLLNKRYTVKSLAKSFPEIDWYSFFDQLLPESVRERLTAKSEVIVDNPVYFARLQKLLQPKNNRAIAGFLITSLIYEKAELLNDAFADKKQALMKVLYGLEAKEKRWRFCVDKTNSVLRAAVSAMYINKHFGTETKVEASRMVENIISASELIIKELNWMDKTTKSAAMKKARAMVRHIGNPAFVSNITLVDQHYQKLNLFDDDSFFEMIIKVDKWQWVNDFEKLFLYADRKKSDFPAAVTNAWYNPWQNSIMFPAGILQPSFFHPSFPKYINYGAMGSIVGHEISHGFDNKGSEYDEVGNKRNWWTPESLKEYQNKTDCFDKQYSNYVEETVIQKVNGQLTLGENIADNGGLLQAYRAYQIYSSKTKEPTLPGLSLTNEQAFFISFASNFCSHIRPELAKWLLVSDPHSPNQVRVVGTVSNSKEFARAFDCKSNAKLNPKQKCEIWSGSRDV